MSRHPNSSRRVEKARPLLRKVWNNVPYSDVHGRGFQVEEQPGSYDEKLKEEPLELTS